MAVEERAAAEVKAFEYNAKEGVRAVAFIWFLQRIAAPLFFVFLFAVIMAFAVNGVVAGLLCLAIFGGPALLLWWFTSRQGQKVLEYWKK
ncbi:hypothetical protein [Phaeobacter porticola]|uniref:Uncharacterized protein n=1 Tax=Phaeobacter porticola TaxID=1844006 RepID=A0A1L3I4G8_9RHOB|nr:hypothetical protein [Phaeobacter porticola]APG46967.1 hypothetical protein PhaeoP97_01547 [Phaeobacter porticola]